MFSEGLTSQKEYETALKEITDQLDKIKTETRPKA